MNSLSQLADYLREWHILAAAAKSLSRFAATRTGRDGRGLFDASVIFIACSFFIWALRPATSGVKGTGES